MLNTLEMNLHWQPNTSQKITSVLLILSRDPVFFQSSYGSHSILHNCSFFNSWDEIFRLLFSNRPQHEWVTWRYSSLAAFIMAITMEYVTTSSGAKKIAPHGISHFLCSSECPYQIDKNAHCCRHRASCIAMLNFSKSSWKTYMDGDQLRNCYIRTFSWGSAAQWSSY